MDEVYESVFEGVAQELIFKSSSSQAEHFPEDEYLKNSGDRKHGCRRISKDLFRPQVIYPNGKPPIRHYQS